MIEAIFRVIGLLAIFGCLGLVIHGQVNWDGTKPDEDELDDWP